MRSVYYRSLMVLPGMQTVTLSPTGECFINKAAVRQPVQLRHGCVVELGRRYKFRFNHPSEAQRLRQLAMDAHTKTRDGTEEGGHDNDDEQPERSGTSPGADMFMSPAMEAEVKLRTSLELDLARVQAEAQRVQELLADRDRREHQLRAELDARESELRRNTMAAESEKEALAARLAEMQARMASPPATTSPTGESSSDAKPEPVATLASSPPTVAADSVDAESQGFNPFGEQSGGGAVHFPSDILGPPVCVYVCVCVCCRWDTTGIVFYWGSLYRLIHALFPVFQAHPVVPLCRAPGRHSCRQHFPSQSDSRRASLRLRRASSPRLCLRLCKHSPRAGPRPLFGPCLLRVQYVGLGSLVFQRLRTAGVSVRVRIVVIGLRMCARRLHGRPKSIASARVSSTALVQDNTLHDALSSPRLTYSVNLTVILT